MKLMRPRSILLVLFALIAVAGMRAECGDIRFRALPPSDSSLSASVSEILESKVVAILGRTRATAPGGGMLGLEPSLRLNGQSSTSGLVQNVETLSGEFVLTVRDLRDNTALHSQAIPLKVTLKAGSDPMETLAKAIKPSEAVYVRFIRTARNRVCDLFPEYTEAEASDSLQQKPL